VKPSRRCLVAVAGLALLAAPALVGAQNLVPDPVGKLTPPAGWTTDAGRSAGLEKTVGGEEHFGGARVHVSAQYLHAPRPGGILFVTEVVTEGVPPDPGAAATRELHAARAGADAMTGGAQVVRWDVEPAAGGNVAEARLEWKDASLGTTTISRTLVFQLDAGLVRLAAECIIADDAAALRAPCEQALDTLAPLAPASARKPLTVLAQAPAVAAPVGSDAEPAAAPVTGGPPAPAAPTLRAHEGELPTTLVVSSPKKKTDRRPLYVLAGLVVIALAYWWNRREKARLAASESAAPAPATSTSVPTPAAKASEDDAP